MGKMLAPVTEDVTKLSANLVPRPSLLITYRHHSHPYLGTAARIFISSAVTIDYAYHYLDDACLYLDHSRGKAEPMDRQATEKSERELGDVTIVQKLGYAYNARRVSKRCCRAACRWRQAGWPRRMTAETDRRGEHA